jgi:DNA primase
LIDAGSAIVCEGQLDLITIFEAGITNVVAPQGTAFTEHQARILKRFVSEVILCFDADEAGQKAAERSLDALLQTDLVVRVAEMPPGQDPDSLIRQGGKEEFEARITAARDFFDFWIEREVALVDLDSLGQKMQLARKLAEVIARLPAPLMRAEVANKVSARLGVARNDFERLLARPVRPRFQAPEADRAITPPPRHEIAMLCLLALRDAEAREFLRAQNWQEVLAQTPDAEILVRILESDFQPGDSASINAFMAGLPARDEALISSWLLQRMPPNAVEVARGWWAGLRQATLRRQLQIAEGRMKLPRLSPGEELNLQKQILDLQGQIHELSQFSSARVLDI